MESFVIDLNPLLACKEIHYINFFNTLFAACTTLFFQSAVQNRGVCYTQECTIPRLQISAGHRTFVRQM